MSLPRKGRRRIVVDGSAYLWRIRQRPTYTQGLASAGLSFAVQQESSPACTLLVSLQTPRPDNWMGLEGAIVTSALVARTIRLALAQGWRPERSGSALCLQLDDSGRPSGPVSSPVERP
ncbi:hypothetical protein [Comamonas composti]|uniref:hypothetical protein n=1 Tax=Comamonas composti TaxID=408558 RepID=UPI000426F8E3|nr:hypothetical protein [Comamonas composti]